MTFRSTHSYNSSLTRFGNSSFSTLVSENKIDSTPVSFTVEAKNRSAVGCLMFTVLDVTFTSELTTQWTRQTDEVMNIVNRQRLQHTPAHESPCNQKQSQKTPFRVDSRCANFDQDKAVRRTLGEAQKMNTFRMSFHGIPHSLSDVMHLAPHRKQALILRVAFDQGRCRVWMNLEKPPYKRFPNSPLTRLGSLRGVDRKSLKQFQREKKQQS